MIEHNGILFPDAWGEVIKRRGPSTMGGSGSSRKEARQRDLVAPVRSVDEIKASARKQLQEKLNAQHARWSVLP